MPIDEKPVAQVIINSQALYGKEVNINRAIPDLRDGLKPVQRRILYTAFCDHLGPNARYKKVATVSGDVLSLHPHGDASVNDAMIPVSQSWRVNAPLIDIHGNNGAIDGSGAAAPRYIEMRMHDVTELLLNGLSKNAVDFQLNYDSTKEEPEVLPASWPVAMINGSFGIAFGMASNILPHNPREMLKAAIYLVKDPQDKAGKLKEISPGPDFPTGGIIVGKEAGEKEIEHGKAQYTVRGKVEQSFKNRRIVVTEVPYGVGTQQLLESFEDLLDPQPKSDKQKKKIKDETPKKQILGITSIIDETTEEPRVVINFKQRATKEQMETALNLLYTDRKSLLQTTITANNNLVWQRKSKMFGIHEYLLDFLEFRKETLRRILTYDVKAAKARLNIVKGLLRVVDMVDQILPEAKASQNREDLEKRLVKKFDFNPEQAHAIAGIAVYRLGRQNVKALEKEDKQLTKEVTTKTGILASNVKLKHYLIHDLENTLEFFKGAEYDRKTRIIAHASEPKAAVDVNDLVKPEPIKVAVKSTGVLQQMTAAMYENSKDDPANPDDLLTVLDTQTTNVVMGLTRNGLAYVRMAGELPYQNLKSEPNSVQMIIPSYKRDDETIKALSFEEKQAQNYFIVSVTACGYLKVVNVEKCLPSLSTKRYLKLTTKYNGLKLDGDYVVKDYILTADELKNASLHFESNKKRARDRKIKLSDEHVEGVSGSGRRLIKLDPSNDEKFTVIHLELPESEDADQKVAETPTEKTAIKEPVQEELL